MQYLYYYFTFYKKAVWKNGNINLFLLLYSRVFLDSQLLNTFNIQFSYLCFVNCIYSTVITNIYIKHRNTWNIYLQIRKIRCGIQNPLYYWSSIIKTFFLSQIYIFIRVVADQEYQYTCAFSQSRLREITKRRKGGYILYKGQFFHRGIVTTVAALVVIVCFNLSFSASLILLPTKAGVVC